MSRPPMRLDRFLSECSAFSRKQIRQLVRAGAVTVDGRRAGGPDDRVTETAAITVNGQPVVYRKYVYLMLNKPLGYLSATEDAHDPVVVELVPEEYRHFAVFPVGRLDKDTSGLLLLTNDGAFDHALTSPRKNIYKRYEALLDRPAEPADVDAFHAGMTFREFTARSALLEISAADPRRVAVEIAEGKFHQVRRMCERVGKTVLELQRVAIGPLRLDGGLKPGEVRELTDRELRLLRGGETSDGAETTA